MLELLIQLAIFALLLLIGLSFGRVAERRHLRELAQREAASSDVLLLNGREPPDDRAWREAALVVGSAVIAEDYFKRVAARVRSFFGGRVTVYETLLERGRREAILRMKEEARRRGATLILNVRLETSSLAEEGGGLMFSAEFLAYGTALTPA